MSHNEQKMQKMFITGHSFFDVVKEMENLLNNGKGVRIL